MVPFLLAFSIIDLVNQNILHKENSDPRQKLFLISNDCIGILSCLFIGILLSYAVIFKYVHFGTQDWDLAFFTQALWNLKQGSLDVSLVGVNFLGDHAYLISFLILPVFALLPHPLTLEIVKILAFVSSGFLFYKMSKRDLGWLSAFIFMVLYLTFPPNVFGILYDFNPETLSPVFLLGMYYSFKTKRFLPFMVWAVLTMLVKENMSLVVIAFGLYAFFPKTENKIRWGVFPLILGSLWFVLTVFFMIPYFRGTEVHPFVVRYQHLGQTVPEIFHSVIFNPQQTFSMIFDARNIKFIGELFGPFLIPALLSGQILFFMSPILLQHLLSASAPEHSIMFHYAVTMAPFIFLATVETLGKVSKYPTVFKTALFTLSLLSIFNFFSHAQDFKRDITVHHDYLTAYRWSLVKAIPQGAGVVATFSFLPELSRRKELFSFHKIFSVFFQQKEKIHKTPLYSSQSFLLPRKVSYALIDFKDRWILHDLKNNPEIFYTRVQDFFREPWRVEKAAGDTVLFKKDPFQGTPLIERFPILSSDIGPWANILIDQTIRLVLYQVENPIRKNKNELLIPITFLWQAVQKTSHHYVVVFQLKKDNQILLQYQHMIGYGVYPTGVWNPGDYQKEHFWLPLPHMEKGSYSLEIQCRNLSTGAFVEIEKEGHLEMDHSLNLATIEIPKN